MISSPLADVTSISVTADIDRDLAILAESMRVLHSRRNALLPISRLPTEILATVFEYFEEEKRFDESADDDVPACLAVTHVCRHWRNVALDCPALWRFIRSSSPGWIDIMLERSKNAPLVVTYKSEVPLQGFLEPILLQLPRIKVLRFSSLSPDVDPIIRLLSSQPAPLLEVFEFCNLKSWADSDPTTRLILSTIFQGRAPRLRSVELRRLSLNWTAHIFSGLRTLCVKGTTFFPTTLPELLSALRRMPALEQLTLEQLSIISEETKLLDRVPLARLKSIALGTASIQTAASLFAQLAIPVDAKLALQLTQIQGRQDFSDLFLALDMHPDRSSPAIRSLRAIYISPHSFCVQLSTSTTMNPPNSWNPQTCDDDIQLSIHFTYDESAQVVPSIIFDICRLVTQPEDRIQKFFVGSDFELPDSDFWRAGSAFLPDVEIIHMNSTFIGGLMDALRINEGEQKSDMQYPSLRALQVDAAPFMDREPEELQDVIKMRARHGVRIQDLRLEKCSNLCADQVQGLMKVVTTVHWDKYKEPLGDGLYDGDEDEAWEGWVNWASTFLEH